MLPTLPEPLSQPQGPIQTSVVVGNIAALAFKIDTRNAEIFRRWLMERAMQPTQPPVSVLLPWSETDLQLSSFIRIASALGVMLRLDVNLA